MHKFFKVDALHPHHAVQSNFVTPKTLAWMRTVLAGYGIVTLLAKLVLMAGTPINYVMYITNYSYYSLVVYLMASAYLSWRYVLSPVTYTPWQGYHWGLRMPYFVLYQAAVVSSFIVGIVYWGMLARKELPGSSGVDIFFSISMHGMNMILAACEIYFSKNPFIFSHVLIYLPILLLYVPLSHILHHYTGKWAYFFLDYHQAPVLFACFIVGINVLIVALHYGLVWLHVLRNAFNKFDFPESEPSISEKSTNHLH